MGDQLLSPKLTYFVLTSGHLSHLRTFGVELETHSGVQILIYINIQYRPQLNKIIITAEIIIDNIWRINKGLTEAQKYRLKHRNNCK